VIWYGTAGLLKKIDLSRSTFRGQAVQVMGKRGQKHCFCVFFEFCQKKFAQTAFMCDNIYTSLAEVSVRPQASSEGWVFLFMESRMSRYCFYVDGFNVYYALEENLAFHKYK
jgi:hypothetical protein